MQHIGKRVKKSRNNLSYGPICKGYEHIVIKPFEAFSEVSAQFFQLFPQPFQGFSCRFQFFFEAFDNGIELAHAFACRFCSCGEVFHCASIGTAYASAGSTASTASGSTCCLVGSLFNLSNLIKAFQRTLELLDRFRCLLSSS